MQRLTLMALLGFFAYFLLACAPAATSDDNADLNNLENLVWKTTRVEASRVVLAQVRSFDLLFANASEREISKTLLEIVARAEAYKDTNGKLYQPSILISSQGNNVVLTFADLVAETPDLEQNVLSSRLFKSVIKAMDAVFTRGKL